MIEVNQKVGLTCNGSAPSGREIREAGNAKVTPVVSICMPHLNSRPFTEERMDTILRQTLSDWKLIVVDSNSDDGSREILKRYAEGEPRIRIVDGPRDGIYTNLNRALTLCTGEYVYIATSDDTMTSDCLEEMVKALEQNPNCGVAHCCLEITDEHGIPVRSEVAWENWLQQKYFGEWIHIPHVRQAPHDGLLHFGFYSIYTSLTQLLVRRRVFEELGLFRTDCSPHADFEWGMRIGLNENVVHVPRKLATWRRHTQQATQLDQMVRNDARGEYRRLVREALKSLKTRQPTLAKALKKSELHRFHLASEVRARKLLAGSNLNQFLVMGVFALRHPVYSVRWLFHKLVLRDDIADGFFEKVNHEFVKLGLTNLVTSLSNAK
jgi:glycosyltransferase involved in cell wall biosynthesis